MELKKRFVFKDVFFKAYIFAFFVYLGFGFLPAVASNYEIDARLEIPVISLASDVTALELEDGKLNTPGLIVGSFSRAENKTLLIGHSTTVFKNLEKISLDDEIIYHDKTYKVVDKILLEKKDISMNKLLRDEKLDTIIIMTCAGELLEGQDATHRLIITAEVL